MSLVVRDLSKAFEDLQVLRGVDLTFGDSGIYCLMGSSGTGKTTFLRILMGLEKADCGVIEGVEGKRFSAVFQEDRLCEDRTPMENVMMVAERSVTREAAQRELCRILPEESIWRPVYTLSGGMKRRTAVCRALLASFDILLMDEPFTGLDEDTRTQVIRYVRERTQGKLVILSTHMEEDARELGAEVVRLGER
ncbi:MAG: ATP-binding cassette domain-containing protein [Hungatella sp.]|jgi:NitT/TauT family transport system ATP-binding protein|nr:ATP-binding cassette domain-containing protein [Hungatella sp.]